MSPRIRLFCTFDVPLTLGLRMQAAWTGDIGTIKSLTLQAWGPNNEQAPLNMAIFDDSRNSPFSIAFLRGHYQTAKAILEIIRAQWSAPEKEKVRYKMQSREEDEEDEEEEDDEGESDNELRIVSETIDQAFTIDDIGKVSMQVKSHTRPIDVIRAQAPGIVKKKDGSIQFGATLSLFVHVINDEDTAGLKVLLGLVSDYEQTETTGDEDESVKRFNLESNDFLSAVQSGNTEALSLLIKRTGAGIPLDHLVKKSGAELKQKPRFYQGLTVYGKKRYENSIQG